MNNKLSNWGLIVGVTAAATASMASAADLVTRIHAVQPGLDGAAAQVLATVDGRVYDLPAKDAEGRAFLEKAVLAGKPVRLELDATDETIVTVADVSTQEARLYEDDLHKSDNDAMNEKLLSPIPTDYQPTIFNTQAEIERLFRTMNTRTRGSSQCYQRASYWTYNMHRSSGTRSMKVFMFFTNAYRSMSPPRGMPAHRWWFHVSPMVYLQDGTQITERVLDGGWDATRRAPLTMKQWTDEFIDTHKECRVIESYAAVNADNDEWRRDGRRVRAEAYRRDHCLLRIVPMYYYQPADIENLDLEGQRQTTWSSYAVANHHCAVDFCM